MPRYHVTTRKTTDTVWAVEAETEDDAIKLYDEGFLISNDYSPSEVVDVVQVDEDNLTPCD